MLPYTILNVVVEYALALNYRKLARIQIDFTQRLFENSVERQQIKFFFFVLLFCYIKE